MPSKQAVSVLDVLVRAVVGLDDVVDVGLSVMRKGGLVVPPPFSSRMSSEANAVPKPSLIQLPPVFIKSPGDSMVL